MAHHQLRARRQRGVSLVDYGLLVAVLVVGVMVVINNMGVKTADSMCFSSGKIANKGFDYRYRGELKCCAAHSPAMGGWFCV